jgi:hypothetical protein
MRFPIWNPDATKIGMCSTPSPGQRMSVLAVHNSTAFGSVLGRERDRFNKLFKRRAMTHHFTEFMELDGIKDAESVISSVIEEYSAVEAGIPLPSQEAYGDLSSIQLFPSF